MKILDSSFKAYQKDNRKFLFTQGVVNGSTHWSEQHNIIPSSTLRFDITYVSQCNIQVYIHVCSIWKYGQLINKMFMPQRRAHAVKKCRLNVVG